MVPVCSPALAAGLGQPTPLAPQALAGLPLLQQSTRPTAWRQWFEAAGVAAPMALSGPRYELFSMTAAAAAQGLGLALVPRLLVEPELARGELVVACDQVLPGDRAYYLVQPERGEERPALAGFKTWLMQATQTAAGKPQ
jgi:LysR family glycine cleavage system transcriptional activator